MKNSIRKKQAEVGERKGKGWRENQEKGGRKQK